MEQNPLKADEQQEPPKDDHNKIVLNMESIIKRSQQITTLSVVVGIIAGISSWIWGFIFVAPMKERIAHDKEQDQKIELIIENQKKQDQQYFEIRKDQAVYGEKVNAVYEALTAIREYMKEDYKR